MFSLAPGARCNDENITSGAGSREIGVAYTCFSKKCRAYGLSL
jgi:hypothetical protein